LTHGWARAGYGRHLDHYSRTKAKVRHDMCVHAPLVQQNHLTNIKCTYTRAHTHARASTRKHARAYTLALVSGSLVCITRLAAPRSRRPLGRRLSVSCWRRTAARAPSGRAEPRHAQVRREYHGKAALREAQRPPAEDPRRPA
jgi:hypothetical protein